MKKINKIKMDGNLLKVVRYRPATIKGNTEVTKMWYFRTNKRRNTDIADG